MERRGTAIRVGPWSGPTATDPFIYGQVTSYGSPLPGYYTLGDAGTTATWDEPPTVSPLLDEYGPNRRFFVAWHDVDSMGYPYPWINGVLATIGGDAGPVTTLDFTGPTQHKPRAEYDGQRLILTYFEDTTSANQDVFVSSFSINGSAPVLGESHLPVGTTLAAEYRPSICSKHSSGASSTTCMTVWERQAATFLGHHGTYTIPAGIYGALTYAP